MTRILTINRTPGDHIRDTSHLTVEDRGALQVILDNIVVKGQDEEPPSLPDDDQSLATMLGWSVAKWRKTKERLCTGPLRVLEVADGRITHPQTVTEIEAARERIRHSSRAGKASGKARRVKRDLPHERPLNASSTTTEVEMNARSTRDGTEFNSTGYSARAQTDPDCDMKRSSHESRVMSHDEGVDSASPLLVLGDSLPAADIVQRTLAAIAPEAPMPDDAAVNRWLRFISPDPWMIAAVLCEAMLGLQSARSLNYIQTVLLNRKKQGWPFDTTDDARRYVQECTNPQRLERVRSQAGFPAPS